MPRPKMKAGGQSPARSEPQTPAGSQNLLRTALTRSAAARRPKGMNDSKRSEGNTSALSDLSNLSGLNNTSLNNTQAKKIAALAAYKAMENEITPRQAIREFNQANLSTAMTPSLFFPRKSTRKRKAEAVAEPAAELENSVDPDVVEEEEEEEDVSSEASSSELAGVTRRKSARLSRTRGITMEDLDPDKDLTKPTNVSASVRPSEDSLLLDDTADATMMALKRRREKPKKKHFTLSDFDISQMPKPSERAEEEKTLSQSMASDDSRDASQLVVDEKMKKRREMLEKKMLRKKKMLKPKPSVQQWDFSGIEPPAPVTAPEKETAQATAEVLSPPEELPEVSPSGQGGGKERRPMDFSNLLEIGDDDDEENFVAKEKEAESVEEEGGRRKSVYKAGNTSQKSLMLDQSEFRPETESTRIASVSSVSNSDFQMGAKPGRDTSTPFVTRSQQALSKSAVVSREQVGEFRANKTVEPRLPSSSLTPRTANLESQVRKPGLTLSEVIVEGGTQTSPHLEADVGCQVTPSLAEPSTASASSPRPANISHLSASEKSSGQGQRHQLNDLTNSVAEEINIDLPPEEEDEESEAEQQNITNSGRKNPSPILERRNEVEDVDEFDDDEEEEEDEVFVEPHQRSSMADKEHLLTTGDVEEGEAENGEELEDMEDMEDGEDGEEVGGESRVVSQSLAETSSSKAQSSSREVRDLRQARLTRYLGIQDSASPLVSPLSSPEKEKVVEKPKPKPKPRKKVDPKLIFPAKQVKFEYQRFSRYKLKPESESTLVKASQDFLNEALKRMSRWAGERGANNIHLCDIKRMMEQCGFVPNQAQDPHLRVFHETIRDIGRRQHVEELIPCNLGRGEIYPPKDCWEVTGEKKRKKKKAKADQVKRLKVDKHFF